MSCYELRIFIDSTDTELLRLYEAARDKHNALFLNTNIKECDKYYDAGFDLFVPGGSAPLPPLKNINTNGIAATTSAIAGGNAPLLATTSAIASAIVDHHVKCAMKMYTTHNGVYNVGYYLYPRSSTGSKTPLRLANSVGIIDSGYRGNIIAVFDNISGVDYTIEQYQRLVQICPPDISYPFIVVIVSDLKELGCDTMRGSGGFGSSGK